MEDQNPYKELDRGDSPQIRLLKIELAKSNDEVIKVNLYTKSLDKPPRFKALSYVWGDENCTTPILLNGLRFGVTYNLHAALKALRSKPNKSFLWVDAICVNQRDTSEKSHQISLMARIYSEAREVLCWLGPSTNDDSVFPFIQKCAELNRAMILPLPRPEIPIAFASKSDAIRDILLRPYWYRVWVIQENVLARKRLYLCGMNEISSDDLYQGLVQIGRSLHLKPKRLRTKSFLQAADDLRNFNGYGMLANTFIGPRELMNHTISDPLSLLIEAMMDTARFMATDPRDHLYGILGLFPELAHLITPDYTKSPTAVFLDFALLNLKEDSRLIARSGIGHKNCTRRRRSCNNLPSWVPNHSGPFVESRTGISIWTAHIDIKFEAGTFCPQELKWHLAHDTLVLRASGVQAGRITSVLSPDTSFRERMVKWNCCAAANITDHAYISWRRAFYRTILMDRDRMIDLRLLFKNDNAAMDFIDERMPLDLIHSISMIDTYILMMQSIFVFYPRKESQAEIGHHSPVHPTPSIQAERSYWLPKNQDSQLNDLYLGEEKQHSVKMLPANDKMIGESMLGGLKLSLANEVDRITRDRSFVLTEYGHMALAPLGAQAGDHVVLIGGCPVPLVLRKQGEDYQVIGDTYVCGLMEGQMSENVSAGTAHIEDFRLI
ncbi:hypothetical protein CMEL01_15197 [Colletotrichum melonis]|uniref:Heterokaryon incompatibility domain-containing protein n=1 Tax=Colletotrichum melonis TaxID=1209925 RepID=A0AAI9ULU9_9PEZI|nr:hypothetical protein CMEL01_15197 [Colletotrichum melonis]